MNPADAALLVVDDNEDNRYTLTQRLARAGYTNVAVATNGREALELLAARSFDLVLLDVMMPELNGYEVLERLKGDARLRQVPVIMISALDQLDSAVRCIELGAEDYLAKPFNPTLLRARVGATLEKKRMRDATAAHLARIESELQSAREIQLGLVPGDFPLPTTEAPAEIFATLLPARQVGGDLYDFFYIDPHTLCVVIADVSDKGAPAALFMAHANSMIRVVATLLRTADGAWPTPAAVLAKVNEELCRGNSTCMFVTVFFAMLNLSSNTLSFCNAGHNVPYLLDRRRNVTPLAGGRSKPLGISRGFAYATESKKLASGDTLFLYTDGITEAMNDAGDLFGDHRVREALRDAAGSSPQHIVSAVVSSVRAFAGATPQSDDIAAIAVALLRGAAEAEGVVARAEIVIKNQLDDLARAVHLLDQFAATHSVSSDVLAELQIALDEVLANIIHHAYADKAVHDIHIEFRALRDAIEMQVEDDGLPFDPLSLASPDTAASVGTRQIGGLGIHLVRRLMSEVAYARTGDRNRLILRKKLGEREQSRHGRA